MRGDEQQRLFLLAKQPPPAEPSESGEQVSAALRRVLDALVPFPAYMLDRRWNYLAWNTAH